MGWAYGTNNQGREIGYGVEATCDDGGCEAKIDRGVSYVCGGEHDGGEKGCGRYFCGDHLSYGLVGRGIYQPYGAQLCDECAASYDEDSDARVDA